MKVGSLTCECGQQFEFRTRRSFVDCPKCEERKDISAFPKETIKEPELTKEEELLQLKARIEELLGDE